MTMSNLAAPGEEQTAATTDDLVKEQVQQGSNSWTILHVSATACFAESSCTLSEALLKPPTPRVPGSG